MGAAASTAGSELPAPSAQEQEVQVCTGLTDLSAYVKDAIEGLNKKLKFRSCAVPCLAFTRSRRVILIYLLEKQISTCADSKTEEQF